jgi:YD repeat-containing protein
VNLPAKTVSFTYDADGNRASLTYPGGTAVGYGYTARNQMSGVMLNPTLITPDSFWGKQGASMPRIS